MQRLRSIYRAVHFRMKHHRPFGLAAQIAFYFLLALQPLLILLTALLAYLPLHELEPRIAGFIADAAPGQGGERLAAIVMSVLEHRNPGLMSVAALALLWTASSATKAVIDATTRIRGLDVDPRPWLAVRARAALLTVALVVLLAVGGSLAAGATRILPRLLDAPEGALVSRRGLELVLGFLLMTSGVQLVYLFGPPPPRGPALPGSIAAVLGAVAASAALSLYVQHVRDVNAVYGSLGALVVLVLWFYVVGCALVLGAEVNAAIGGWRGKRTARGAERVRSGERDASLQSSGTCRSRDER